MLILFRVSAPWRNYCPLLVLSAFYPALPFVREIMEYRCQNPTRRFNQYLRCVCVCVCVCVRERRECVSVCVCVCVYVCERERERRVCERERVCEYVRVCVCV